MNKNMFKICFVAALLISASTVYSADITGATTIGGGTFSPSNKVNIGVISTDAEYSAESKHYSGNRILGTNNLDPKMYWTTASVGAACSVPANASVDYSSWTTL